MLPILMPIIKTLGSFAYEAYKGHQKDERLSSIESSLDEQSSTLSEIETSMAEQSSLLSGIETSISEQGFILSALQTSMGVLGVTSIASVATSAFSLYKINQISKEIKNLPSHIDNGFIDMKYFISEEISGLINHQQQVKLSEAYEYYQKALQRFQRALSIGDRELRKHSLLKSIEYFDKALIIYDSQKKFQNLSSAGEFRQLETVMIIESWKSEIYMMMGEVSASKDNYSDLLNRVNKELKEIANSACKHTIDLILLDTFLLKNNDLKLIEHKLSS